MEERGGEFGGIYNGIFCSCGGFFCSDGVAL